MRISPTQLSTYERSPIDWVRTYIGTPMRPEQVPGLGMVSTHPSGMVLVKIREEQSEPMAAGSAFDAVVKEAILGAFDLGQGRVDVDDLVDTVSGKGEEGGWKVALANHEYGVKIAKYLLRKYIDLGAFDSLLNLITGEPFMEEKIHGSVSDKGREVEIGGLPDLFWFDGDVLTVLDWKCSQIKNEKPTIGKGYWRMFAPSTLALPRVATKIEDHSSDGGYYVCTHKEAGAGGGSDCSLEPRWMDQMGMYNWLCGNVDMKPFVGYIDRLVGLPLRVCRYRGVISREHQLELFERLWNMKQAIEPFLDPGFEEILLSRPQVAISMLTEKSSFF